MGGELKYKVSSGLLEVTKKKNLQQTRYRATVLCRLRAHYTSFLLLAGNVPGGMLVKPIFSEGRKQISSRETGAAIEIHKRGEVASFPKIEKPKDRGSLLQNSG